MTMLATILELEAHQHETQRRIERLTSRLDGFIQSVVAIPYLSLLQGVDQSRAPVMTFRSPKDL